MEPRIDREAYPAVVSVQVLKRRRVDQYGNEKGGTRGGRGRDQERNRAVQVRNGLPVRWYEYRGTGASMSPAEAERWLA